jgi:acyl-CoA synthetase (AMP-forming)/AMP-acid ligase II
VFDCGDDAPMRAAGRVASQLSKSAANDKRSAWSASAGRAKEDIDINIEIMPSFGKVEKATEVTSARPAKSGSGESANRSAAKVRALDAAERAGLYVTEGYWGDRGLRDGIEAAAALRPQNLALVDNRRSLTWRALSQQVSAAVTVLADSGVSVGDSVLLIAGNSIEGVVAYHGLLRVGARATLLDRRCGAADVRAALDAVSATLVIIPSEECDRLQLELGTTPQIMLEHFEAHALVVAEGKSWREPDRAEVAVVLFTSGTTSRPKGVTHSINTLTCGAKNMALITETDAATVIFLVSPLTSITGVMQMHLAADQHAALILEDDFEADASLDRINQHQASLLGGAPVIVERLIKAADQRTDGRCSLRTLALGGTMLPRPLLQRVMDDYGMKVARVYGSSEAPNSTGSLPEDDRTRRLTDDGALMPGTEVRVGSAEHPQEGLVRGPGVFLGYLDETDNVSAFEEDWYRTGDLVELSNGRLTVVGRLKEVVNRNGFKISLAEVDAALVGMPDVEESASFALPDTVTGERLAVAVLCKQGSAIDLEDVVAHLQGGGVATRRLPEELVIWDEPLPRTASGKIVRSRLVMDAPAKPSIVAARLREATPPTACPSTARKD